MITEDFQIFLNEDLLLNSGVDLKQTYGLTLPNSYEAAQVWMQSLDVFFSFSRRTVIMMDMIVKTMFSTE